MEISLDLKMLQDIGVYGRSFAVLNSYKARYLFFCKQGLPILAFSYHRTLERCETDPEIHTGYHQVWP
jgi:hypothetical protein